MSGVRDSLPGEITAICDRIAAEEGAIRAIVPDTYSRDRVLTACQSLIEQAPAEGALPPLFGRALGVKDIIHVDGFPTRCGTLVPGELFAGPEAECVTRLLAAGLLVIAKSETTEFASLDPAPTRNPHNPEHTPGGSSSGSAAGVAAGFFDVALGTQTIGSVIRPAAYCGVIGCKPSHGRIPTTGVVPFSPTADQLGYFCRSVGEAEAVAAVLVDRWEAPPDPPAPPRIAVPEGPYHEQATRHGREQFEHTLGRLGEAGWRIDRLPALGNISEINRDHQRLVAAEMARVHAPWFEQYRDRYRPTTLRVIEPGFEIDDAVLAALQAKQVENRAAIVTEMERHGVDLWLCPPAVDSAPRGLASTGDPIMNLPWTHAGLPTISLPTHLDDAGLPHGIQLVGRPGADEALIKVAALLETILDYRSPLL